MYYRDLRAYLETLEQKDKLWKIGAEINKDTELHPLARWQFRGLPEKDRRGFLFENLTDIGGKKYQGRVATAVIGASKDVYALGMQCNVEDIHARWGSAIKSPIAPRLVKTATVKEEI